MRSEIGVGILLVCGCSQDQDLPVKNRAKPTDSPANVLCRPQGAENAPAQRSHTRIQVDGSARVSRGEEDGRATEGSLRNNAGVPQSLRAFALRNFSHPGVELGGVGPTPRRALTISGLSTWSPFPLQPGWTFELRQGACGREDSQWRAFLSHTDRHGHEDLLCEQQPILSLDEKSPGIVVGRIDPDEIPTWCRSVVEGCQQATSTCENAEASQSEFIFELLDTHRAELSTCGQSLRLEMGMSRRALHTAWKAAVIRTELSGEAEVFDYPLSGATANNIRYPVPVDMGGNSGTCKLAWTNCDVAHPGIYCKFEDGEQVLITARAQTTNIVGLAKCLDTSLVGVEIDCRTSEEP